MNKKITNDQEKYIEKFVIKFKRTILFAEKEVTDFILLDFV